MHVLYVCTVQYVKGVYVCMYVCMPQADVSAPRTSALLLFMRRMLTEPAFTELRTKKQLGYIVSFSPSGYGRCVCMYVCIYVCVCLYVQCVMCMYTYIHTQYIPTYIQYIHTIHIVILFFIKKILCERPLVYVCM